MPCHHGECRTSSAKLTFSLDLLLQEETWNFEVLVKNPMCRTQAHREWGLQADVADDILRDDYGDASMRSEADVEGSISRGGHAA